MNPDTSIGRNSAGQDVVSSLAGKQANRERAVGCRTRRVVLASLGVMQDQRAGRRRVRALALAAIFLILLFLGPFLWWAAENLIEEGYLNSPACEIAFWLCILCSAVIAAVLVAGWARNRS